MAAQQQQQLQLQQLLNLINAPAPGVADNGMIDNHLADFPPIVPDEGYPGAPDIGAVAIPNMGRAFNRDMIRQTYTAAVRDLLFAFPHANIGCFAPGEANYVGFFTAADALRAYRFRAGSALPYETDRYMAIELFGFDYQPAEVLNEEDSNTMIVTAMRYLVSSNNDDIARRSITQMTRTPNNDPAADWWVHWEAVVPAADQQALINQTVWGLINLYSDVAGNMTPLLTTTRARIFSQVLVGLAKAGNCTNNYIAKLTREISNNFDGLNLSLDTKTIENIWSWFGPKMNPTRARWLFNQLVEWLVGPQFLNLREAARRACWANLTGYVAVNQALRTYTDFPWQTVIATVPGEWLVFQNATRIIGSNPWYGYSTDLVPVAVTKYPTLAGVAIELIKQVGGIESLKDYMGGRAGRIQWFVMLRLIMKYIEGKRVQAEAILPLTAENAGFIRGLPVLEV